MASRDNGDAADRDVHRATQSGLIVLKLAVANGRFAAIDIQTAALVLGHVAREGIPGQGDITVAACHSPSIAGGLVVLKNTILYPRFGMEAQDRTASRLGVLFHQRGFFGRPTVNDREAAQDRG